MKALIDISEDVLKATKVHNLRPSQLDLICERVLSGIVIPDGATNGDVIKALFDEEDIWDIQTALNLHSETMGWWHMSYQKDVVDKQSETCDNCKYYPNGVSCNDCEGYSNFCDY